MALIAQCHLSWANLKRQLGVKGEFKVNPKVLPLFLFLLKFLLIVHLGHVFSQIMFLNYVKLQLAQMGKISLKNAPILLKLYLAQPHQTINLEPQNLGSH